MASKGERVRAMTDFDAAIDQPSLGGNREKVSDGNPMLPTGKPAPDHAPAHGGAIDAARLRHPNAPEPWIDLSTGINPLPYPLPPIGAEAWARLPLASEERALRDAAAARYGAPDADCIVAAPGTQALIQLLPRLLTERIKGGARRSVAVLSPTYAEHAEAWRREGHDVREVASLAEAEGCDALVIVNPNNPTGRLVGVEWLTEAAASFARRGGLLVVDEAFMDVAEPHASLAPALPPSTVVLRSFGKMYGLAGVRLGFAVAEVALAERLRGALGPWAVSGPALAIGTAALSDKAWLEAARARLAADASHLDALLARARSEIVGGTSLFRLAAHGDASRLAHRLGEHGILVRRFGYNGSWLRFGIPGRAEAWQRLEAAL